MPGTKIQSRAELEELVRAGASLEEVEASGVELVEIDLSGQNLRGARFRYADLSRANLRGASLVGANLRHARLLAADLREADLRGADLSQADLHGAILGNTRTEGIRVEGVKGVRPEVFFSIPQLEVLLRRPGVEFGEDTLKIPGDGREHYRIVPAVRIVEPEGDDSGDRKLLGKVLSHKQIAELGGEVVGSSSVIIGNVAYRCEDGYLGVPATGKVAAAAQPAHSAAPQESASDMDLLKDFLLSKLK